MRDHARSIENLLYTYAERIDAGDLPGVADLFRHGRILPSPDAPREATFEGAAQVLTMYESSTRIYEDGTPRTRHLTTNAIVEVADDEKTAKARSYYTVLQRTEDLPLQPIISGHYHDTFHLVDGQWCFETRTMFIDLIGDLSQHLLYDLG
ncbi:MAG: nuclear transport factor 2 family protein [Candidatus Binatia bacterium]|nr:nuclear transport factor 2 family protein [Candidatus Binatia bacterium]MDG1959079.1 nuclear transport factor 2 family protein [Candidatus Binatia bacterium]MDG2010933.1 nuclear transport factor 2 family protein [Candidatus Binatia bacterium]